MDVTDFFTQALPIVIQRHATLFNRTAGRVCVIVHGVGAWTIRFGDHRDAEAVSALLDLEADLVVTWSQLAFETLIDASFEDAADIRPVTMGNTALLEKLGSLLLPPAKGGLGARLARF